MLFIYKSRIITHESSPTEDEPVEREVMEPTAKKRRVSVFGKYSTDEQRLLLYGGSRIHLQVTIRLFDYFNIYIVYPNV